MIPLSYNVRSLYVRKTTTIAAAGGIALVVAVLASSMMLSAGIKKTMSVGGRPDEAIVLRKGSDTELPSSIEDPSVGLILSAPGVKKDDKGQPMGVAEVVMVLAVEKLGTDLQGAVSNVGVRGVTDNVMQFRPEVRIVDGRPARPGTDEAIVGKRLRGRFAGLELGHSFELRKNRPVKVVGVFEDGGSSYESEVWVDRDTLRSCFGRDGLVSSVRVRLESPASFDAFAAAVEQDKNLQFDAQREPEYYAKQSEGTAMFMGVLGGIIAFFFSIGAMIGAMITMYSTIADRRREIGTLRALGFSKGSILFSFLVESLVLALVGGGLGLAASLSASFIKFSMMNMQTWSEITFAFTPTPRILINAFIGAGVMGLLGGFFPAIRAARTSPVEAMRG